MRKISIFCYFFEKSLNFVTFTFEVEITHCFITNCSGKSAFKPFIILKQGTNCNLFFLLRQQYNYETTELSNNNRQT